MSSFQLTVAVCARPEGFDHHVPEAVQRWTNRTQPVYGVQMVGIWTSSLGMLELSGYILNSGISCDNQRAMMRLRGIFRREISSTLEP